MRNLRFIISYAKAQNNEGQSITETPGKCCNNRTSFDQISQIQQELASKGALDRFLSKEEAQQVSQLFTGLYTLDMVRISCPIATFSYSSDR